ncbi:LptF/LptG family permease [Campylobacter sp. US33a]|uniref:LptF/LptG family permease n=1 Tax=Campylobacter sp. US33a TaxID=2498120 RepID=UPI0010688F97|nr:LptF/LptG family permease [Campylobacter sp. US33a]TEY02393.1 LptF/LptG family permease [Campylobacter sp. US33a]
MKIVYKYLFNQFLSTKLSLFFILFTIISMVFFIQIARITSSIEISFLDLLKLYSFMIPRILIFTLPIAFFIALALSLYRLSKENESIVIFTLGMTPNLIAKFFLKIAFLISTCMLAVALIFIPIAFELQDNFVDYKKTQVNFNYKSGEFGQKFLDWMIFIEKQENDLYKNVVMYYPKKDELEKERLILATEARLERKDDAMSLKLLSGRAYIFDKNETLYLGEFKDLSINTLIKTPNLNIKSFYEYWLDLNHNDKRAKEFVIYTLISLFPFASTLFALSFGIVTYRYDKGYIYLGIFAVICLYFGALSIFYKPPILAVGSIFLLFFISSWLCFKKIIANKY